jgi:hypothetical protein
MKLLVHDDAKWVNIDTLTDYEFFPAESARGGYANAQSYDGRGCKNTELKRQGAKTKLYGCS